MLYGYGGGCPPSEDPTHSCLPLGASLEAGCYLVIRAEPWVQNSSFLDLFFGSSPGCFSGVL